MQGYSRMGSYIYKQIDFEHPSFLFILEDKLKGLLGGPFFYNPYLKTFGLNGNERVLDFGCGGGTGSVCLAKLLNTSGELTCLDVSKYWIDKARHRLRRYGNAKCLVGDIRELDIPESRFDVISIIHVIHDIAHTERQSVTDRLASLLYRHGKLFIREPIKESHGMPVSEIVTLLTNSGLNESQANVSKSEYRGIFGYEN
jgi:2-polyprenyl-3-methyl-5-hydroxy-6-metoxy-1,4-benzoquinol methylase